jgi:uncharacterized protein YlaI
MDDAFRDFLKTHCGGCGKELVEERTLATAKVCEEEMPMWFCQECSEKICALGKDYIAFGEITIGEKL